VAQGRTAPPDPALSGTPLREARISDVCRPAAFKQASQSCQLILSTQSSTFIDHFAPEDVLVAEVENGRSRFERQSQEQLKGWLDRYSLGQIWSKNIIGGRP
jgi:hypothetical protein